jgi:hypothetical protein
MTAQTECNQIIELDVNRVCSDFSNDELAIQHRNPILGILRDFGYDSELLLREQIDEKALIHLRGEWLLTGKT